MIASVLLSGSTSPCSVATPGLRPETSRRSRIGRDQRRAEDMHDTGAIRDVDIAARVIHAETLGEPQAARAEFRAERDCPARKGVFRDGGAEVDVQEVVHRVDRDSPVRRGAAREFDSRFEAARGLVLELEDFVSITDHEQVAGCVHRKIAGVARRSL